MVNFILTWQASFQADLKERNERAVLDSRSQDYRKFWSEPERETQVFDDEVKA